MENTYSSLIPNISYFKERKCSTDWKLPERIIPYYDLTYIISGKIKYVIDGNPYELKEGDVIFVQKGSSRQTFVNSNSPAHYFAFNFDYFFTTETSNTELPFPLIFSIGLDTEIINLCKQFNIIWNKTNINNKDLIARGLFMQILHKLLNFDQSSNINFPIEDKRIRTIKNFILLNITKKIDIETLASIINLHPIYFSAFFKKHTGMSPVDYIQKLRIHTAESLLLTGKYNITEVASLCGFDDPFYFSRLFKKLMGIPPST